MKRANVRWAAVLAAAILVAVCLSGGVATVRAETALVNYLSGDRFDPPPPRPIRERAVPDGKREVSQPICGNLGSAVTWLTTIDGPGLDWGPTGDIWEDVQRGVGFICLSPAAAGGYYNPEPRIGGEDVSRNEDVLASYLRGQSTWLWLVLPWTEGRSREYWGAVELPPMSAFNPADPECGLWPAIPGAGPSLSPGWNANAVAEFEDLVSDALRSPLTSLDAYLSIDASRWIAGMWFDPDDGSADRTPPSPLRSDIVPRGFSGSPLLEDLRGGGHKHLGLLGWDPAAVPSTGAFHVRPRLPEKLAEPAGGDGSTREKAIVIQAKNEDEGVQKEYDYIDGVLGKGKWMPGGQSLYSVNGRHYDCVIAGFAGGRRAFWFDITSFFGKY